MSFWPDRAKTKKKPADGWALKLANEIRTRCRQADRAKDLLLKGFKHLLAAFFLFGRINTPSRDKVNQKAKNCACVDFTFELKAKTGNSQRQWLSKTQDDYCNRWRWVSLVDFSFLLFWGKKMQLTWVLFLKRFDSVENCNSNCKSKWTLGLHRF